MSSRSTESEIKVERWGIVATILIVIPIFVVAYSLIEAGGPLAYNQALFLGIAAVSSIVVQAVRWVTVPHRSLEQSYRAYLPQRTKH